MLQSGEYAGQQVFAPRTVRHATAEQSFWEIDFTLGVPIRYGLGFMLGNKSLGLSGRDDPFAFGHVGLSNVFTWAEPERAISVALRTTGMRLVGPHVIPLVKLLGEIGTVFDRAAARPPSEAFMRPG